jgi:hypothetical protein
MGESYFVQRNVDNKMRVMKKALPCKRLNMPGDRATSTAIDFDE